MSTTSIGSDLMYESVDRLGALVRSGEISATELVQASLDRIEQVDPTINAFVEVFAEDAIAAAAAIAPGDERPFAGVPIAIKDTRGIAGKRLTLGAKAYGDFVASSDHNVVRRLKAAGFVIVGTTAMPALGILPTTESALHGATRNPWDLSRTSGGSSGGSSAAVASGMVPIAHGTDGGGSIRIPAACCGLVGLKPQRGRISQAPDIGHSFLVQDGVLTRTVAETAAVLDVLSGTESGDIAWAPAPPEPFAVTAGRTPVRQRIGLTVSSPVHGVTADAAAVDGVHRAAALLESLGHEVVEITDPPWGDYDFVPAFNAMFAAAVSPRVELAERTIGRALTPGDFEATTWALHSISKNLDSIGFVTAESELHRFARRVVEWMSAVDALIMPVLSEPPVPLGTIDPTDVDNPMRAITRSLEFMPYTPVFNITGQPAISLPIFEQGDGLPLGIQLVGQPAGEGELLSLAAQLERVCPGPSAWPVVVPQS